MRYRHVHLDFHTSGLIPGIGARFDPERFARTLQDAAVDSVTVFAKCHHGWSYHPTQVGRMHPHLGFDLLRAQVEACRRADIRVPIYLSAGWDELAAREHPGWRAVSSTGELIRHHAPPLGAGWAYLDFASPYLDYFCRQVEEVVALYPENDGIFIDICFAMESCGAFAQKRMEAAGLDWEDAGDRQRFTEQIQLEFFNRVSAAVRGRTPENRLFFNFGHVRRGRRELLRFFSHLEIESLPTGFWGYDHFPLSARYVEGLGLDFVAHTGKFHHMWGEMGGYKSPEALTYECGAMIAFGSRCLVGDHLHPSGAMDATTYGIIGAAYRDLRAKEPWAEDTTNRAEIGLLSAEAAAPPPLAGLPRHHNDADEGAVRVLLESKLTFDVLDTDADFAPYRLLVLPDTIRVSVPLAAKLKTYLAAGGKIMLTGESGLAAEGGFALEVGAEWLEPSPFPGGDYALPDPDLRAPFVVNPLFMYLPSQRARVTNGTALGAVFEPYFDRTPAHFSGHRNTPNQPEPSGYPSGVRKGAVTWLAHPVFTAYRRSGAVAILAYVENVIRMALGARPLIETSLPRAGRATLRRQERRSRSILHLLHASPVLRGDLEADTVQVIQDLIPLTGVRVSVAVERPVRSVRLVPAETELEFTEEAGRVAFVVPVVQGHQMIEFTDR
ncbi:MAG TPA: alpha-amylase family protein [Acidocella sp.]|jgi:hypothetical protein|nr:alpha-amylase family protein [Acidocella sp.]